MMMNLELIRSKDDDRALRAFGLLYGINFRLLIKIFNFYLIMILNKYILEIDHEV